MVHALILWVVPPLGRSPYLVLWVPGAIPPQNALYPLSNAVFNKFEQFDVKPISLTGDPSGESQSRPI